MAYKLLIVEDEKEKATGIAYLTGKYNPECRPVLLAHDGREGYEKATAEQPDIIVTDIRMPEMDGLEMIRELKKAGCSAEFIVLSGYAEFSYAKKAIELGVRDFITKPVDEKELSETITRVCGEIATRRKTQDSLGKLNDIRFSSSVAAVTIKFKNPIITLSGVRISWLILARNTDLF